MLKDLQVLYEDNHIIAVFKPAGLLIQGDITGDETLMDWAKEYIKEKYQKSGNVFLGLVHRLDRPVAGIVLFGKTSKGAARISSQFQSHSIRKIYHAVVSGEFEEKEATLIHKIEKDDTTRVASVSESGKEAELHYATIKTNGRYSLLKVEPLTGRFHQIRLQLSTSGHPIVGDSKYGSKEKLADGNIALCATEIAFKTATTDELKVLTIPLPDSWNEFVNSN